MLSTYALNGASAQEEQIPEETANDAAAIWAEREADGQSDRPDEDPADARRSPLMKRPKYILGNGTESMSRGATRRPQQEPFDIEEIGSGGKNADGIPDLIDKGGAESHEDRGQEKSAPEGPPSEGLAPPSMEGEAMDRELDGDWEPDLSLDPLAEDETVGLDDCTYEFFSKLPVQKAEEPNGEDLREKLRGILKGAPGPQSGGQLSAEEKADLEDFLQNIGQHTHDPEIFVAGSFNRHLPAWEELLKGSKRETSRRVLKILRSGVKPQFIGTGETEAKKLDQIRAMLRGVKTPGGPESLLTGQVPHEVEFATTGPSTTTSPSR